MSWLETFLFFFVSTTDIEERVWKKNQKRKRINIFLFFPPPFFQYWDSISFGITAQVEHYDAHVEPPFKTDASVLF